MTDLISSLSIAASGMEAQAQRLRHVSENIANADTPGYHRKTISFRDEIDGGGVKPGPVRLDQSELTRIYDPGHPLANDSGHYDGSNVNLVVEIADAREAQRSYDANLKLFDQARQMNQSLFEILRR
ncbi:flagellar basal body rod protein FlgC [Pseudorhodobacter turbinis]|uniref:Flagellar basal body rod protein FlgC n=1 Tax=Pseudorhodobacter turbinis TaxID=2500533 RepID=A0A4P8EF70_9RHOB|nr:flagellar basal body rod protein FlgC [Pseudorhodobacter turbinis]QCO55323.1 flagellar basal body rod protein FlgC [Pseudorhodobacter turbinis]